MQDVNEIRIKFRISDTQIIRARKVYNIVSLIADVSGLADILMVSTATIISFFITTKMLESSLVAQMGLVYKHL